MLAQILAYQQALDNDEQLDSYDPLDSVKKAVREEIKPLYDKLQADARNKVVQDAWSKDAKDMPATPAGASAMTSVSAIPV